MDISIIILNYRSKGLTLNCIKSIKDADWSGLGYEIIVVDNDSADNIGDILAWQWPDVKFIQAPANLGMGAGNNLGIKTATGRYILVMNPDTLAFNDTFQKFYQYMESQPQVGLVGPKQFNPDRSVQDSCYRWPHLLTPFYRRTFLGATARGQKDLARFLLKDFAKDQVKSVDWLLGSCLFMRAAALAQVGMFDERFFMYFEDTDLCRRFHDHNWQVIYLPEAQIIHNHIRESARDPWYKFFVNRAARQHILSWLKYLNKYKYAKS